MKGRLNFWVLILLIGTVVQVAGIWLYSATSMTSWSLVGRPGALAATVVGLLALLWFAFSKRNRPATIIFMGVGLGAAYLLAFHVVGLAAFPGLLRDSEAQGYWLSLLRVFAVAAIIHTALAAAMFGLTRNHR